MPWTIVRGVYKKGVVQPLEKLPHREGVEVLVLFPEPLKRTEGERAWQRIKQAIAEEMPDLVSMTKDERRGEFARLSKVIAESMPYRSLEEFERAMRGDMTMTVKSSILQKAIEVVESLPPKDQEMLVEVIYRRIVERRRATLVAEVAEAREAYRRGDVRRGTVDDLLI
jgi:predicted DNA-binding antitoxin AbrB/MazE fold protein